MALIFDVSPPPNSKKTNSNQTKMNTLTYQRDKNGLKTAGTILKMYLMCPLSG